VNIVVIQGHPDPRGGHFGHALADAYVRAAGEGGHTVCVFEVAKLAFPFVRSREDLESQALPAVIRDAQSTIAAANHVLLIYPVWNGGTPAVLRSFFEQTFRPGFMFPDARPGEARGFVAAVRQRKGMAGKTGRIVATMQMPAFLYRWYFRPHPETNTLRLGGISPVTETLIGRVEAESGARRDRWLETMRGLGHQGK
jgi:putative NADPH-quinone reductase